MNALVTGAGGLLAHAVLAALGGTGARVLALDRMDLDVTDAGRVRQVVGDEAPDVVFHCAAYTAVDLAQSNEDAAYAVNAEGAAHVAAAAADVGAMIVFPSTDYVFAGTATRPYRPDDPTDPQSVYGRSKLAGEIAVRESGVRHIVARTSWLYGGGGKNFVDTMVRLGSERDELRIVDDQVGRPTWTHELARCLIDLAAGGHEGVFHVAGGGQATWRQLAQEALRLTGHSVRVHPTTTEEFDAPAPRPLYSVLDLTATEETLGRPMEHWRISLARYLTGSAQVPDSKPHQPTGKVE